MEGNTGAKYDEKTHTVTLDTVKQLDPGAEQRFRLLVSAEKQGQGPFVAELSSKALGNAKVAFESETVTSVEPEKTSPSDKTPSKPEEKPKDKSVDKEKSQGAEKPAVEKSKKPEAADSKKPVEAPNP
jgi:hypothetical protein